MTTTASDSLNGLIGKAVDAYKQECKNTHEAPNPNTFIQFLCGYLMLDPMLALDIESLLEGDCPWPVDLDL